MNCTWEREGEHLVCTQCGVPYKGKAADPRRNCAGKQGPPGPGTHLLAILRPLKWFAGKQCGCESYAKQMDSWGPQGCEQRIEEIVAHLVRKADENLPLASWAPHKTKDATARWAVTEAINRARQSGRLEYVSSRRLLADLELAIPKLPPDLSGIVAIPRSGMVPAAHLACRLHLPLYALHNDGLLDLGHGYRLTDSRIPSGPLLAVDDTVCSGWSLRRAKKRWERLGLTQPVKWMGVYVTPPQVENVDYYAVQLPNPHYLEWNLFNSIHVPVLACDFDGVLCYDLPPGADSTPASYAEAIRTARPLHLVRRGELPLIVTARTEDMREATLQWLERWGVSVRQLVMWQGAKEDRRHGAVSKWKAEQYAKSECRLFVESDPTQAKLIHDACKRPVLCPVNETIYQ